jgi:sulfite oxidase
VDVDNNDLTFVVGEERKGWKGYVEWEDYPEKKARARERFSQYTFPPPPEFQLGPVPATNPVLEGVRWKLWHKAIGGALANVPEDSWKTVLEVLLASAYKREDSKLIIRKGETSRHAPSPSISI